MNKRKTLRLTSILMALMMMFGLLSVLMVPWGTAGAAGSANIGVTIDSKDVSDTHNIVITDNETYNIKVDKILWGNANDDFDSILMTLKDPSGAIVSGYQNIVLSPSTEEEGLYTTTFKADPSKFNNTINTTGNLGLYTAVLTRLYPGSRVDKDPIEVAAFYLARKHTGTTYIPKLIVTTPNRWVPVPADEIVYTAQGADTEVALLGTEFSTSYDYRLHVGGKFLSDKFIAKNTAYTYKYQIPKDAAHGSQFEYNSLWRSGIAGQYDCVIIPIISSGQTALWHNTLTVDAKGPEFGEIVVSHENYIGKKTEGIWFANAIARVGHAQIEVSSIEDINSGIDVSKYFVRFTNAYNPSQVLERTIMGASLNNNDTYFTLDKYPDGLYHAFDFTTATFERLLIDGLWKVEIGAVDNLNNENVISYGNVRVYNTYYPVVNARVEAQNAIYMYVGQTLTKQEILDMNIKVDVNVLPSNNKASFPEAWYWFVGADDSNILDYDPDASTVTALNTGEARLQVRPMNLFTGENLSSTFTTQTGSYVQIIVTDQPTVTSLTLNNSSLTLDVGQSQKLTATVNPSAVKVTWETSDSSVATVDANGNVTGVKAGTAVIFAKAGHLTKSCVVTVKGEGTPAEEVKNGWKDEGGARYYYVDGKAHVGWRKIDGNWYFFDYSTAKMRAGGWLKEGGKWYYLNTNGVMKHDEWFKDTNGKWYWLKSSGAMAIGWEKVQGTWYYLSASGAMQTGWVNVRGIWYYMKASGAMYEGWLLDGGVWYYLTPGGGAMVTGTVTIGGRKSDFATSGRWLGYV